MMDIRKINHVKIQAWDEDGKEYYADIERGKATYYNAVKYLEELQGQ